MISTTIEGKYEIITPTCKNCGERGEKKIQTEFLMENGWVCLKCLEDEQDEYFNRF